MSEDTQYQPFFVDRAKTGRAACKDCKNKCVVGELRIAKLVPSPYGDGQVMKSWYHVDCLMNVLLKQRPATKRIDSIDDIGNWETLCKEDQNLILDKLNETEKLFAEKHNGKYTAKTLKNEHKLVKQPDQTIFKESESKSHTKLSSTASRDDNLSEFTKLCNKIASVSAYTAKTNIVNNFLTKGADGKSFNGDLALWCKFLLPQVTKRVYNLKSKQLIKLFSKMFDTDQDNMLTHLEQGDVSETISYFFNKAYSVQPSKNSTLTIQDVESFLSELSKLTKEDEQIYHFKKIVKQCTLDDLKTIIRLIKADLRINAGPKHILEGVHPDAYSVFQTSQDLDMVLNRVLPQSSGVKHKDALQKNVHAKLSLMTPVLPMLAEACKSVEMAMRKCPNGMFSEIKYDGERVQVHKKGREFKYFSRALKPVMPHKVSHFKDYLPQAFPEGEDLILDAEVLMIDVITGKPLPFGSLGIHKQSEFKDAQVCLFVFDCLYYNGQVLMDLPIRERRKILLDHMTEVQNHVMFSEQKLIKKSADLADMIAKVLQLGLEGLVLKDLESKYEPGKRHWLKVKKDYLFDGAMADTADLVVLGAWFGSGKKGGMMSVFLMGCLDTNHNCWVTVTKVHTGHDDYTLEKLQSELSPLMTKISQDSTKVPSWLKCNSGLVPDFVAKDPKNQPVWEITGTEFTKANVHTADGISIRFPRVTRIRSDKNWQTATNLCELKQLFKTSKEKTDVSLLNKLAEAAKSDSVSCDESTKNKFKGRPTKVKTLASISPKTKSENLDTSQSSDSSLNKSSDSNNSKVEMLEANNSSKLLKRKQPKRDDLNTTQSFETSACRSPKRKKFKGENLNSSSSSETSEKVCNATFSNKGVTKSNVKLLPDAPLPDIFQGRKLSFYPDFISFSEEERRLFERHWIAYGGETVKSVHATDIDFLLHNSSEIKFRDMVKLKTKLSPHVRHITKNWLIKCINDAKLCDTEKYAVTVLP